MSYEFLAPTAPDVVARSPMERQARKAGARFEVRDGWNVAVAYAGEASRAARPSRFADASHMRKHEVQGDLPTGSSSAARRSTATRTWLPMTRDPRARARRGAAAPRRARRHDGLRARCGSPARSRARRSRASPRSTCARR